MSSKKFIQICFLLFFIISFSLVSLAEEAFHQPVFVIGQDVQSINDYMKADPHNPQGIMAYTAINDLRGLSEPVDHGAGTNYVDQLLQKYPQIRIVQIGLYMRYMLKETASGGLDKNIDQLGEWIKKSKKQVYLRIGYEFDNPENGYDPQQYIKAYRHIVDRLRTNGVKNVYFVWHSIAWIDTTWPAFDPLKWYPGDEYVDWMGISFFDIKRDEERRLMAEIAKQKNKPLMIAESSPFNQYTVEAKLKWMQELFRYIREYQIPFLSYINVNWDKLPLFVDQKWGDARLENNPALITEWLKEIAQFKK